MTEKPGRTRCAVYTRKSTDEGLEQDFNSLDAQREAGEAYVASQKNEGWECLPGRYDDGGYSGGNIDRPAFQQLMADIEAGKVDCIVVYKIDRLSRSLMDFARIMEVLERNGVSLVSVTQQFNTTSSMGRLTLNILLSFAQFEREIISERTRDKMTAARRRGKWTGGTPVLGYDVHPKGGRLLVNKAEAERVRAIFSLYLDEGSLQKTVDEIRRRNWKTKRFRTREGAWRGGLEFNKPGLRHLLSNVIYLGKVSCKGDVFDGEHEAIVDEDIFIKVQRQLRTNRAASGPHVRNKYGALLKGLVRCKHCGCGMTHHFTTRGARRYRYYVCIKAQKHGWNQCPSPSLPAHELEGFVVEQMRSLGRDAGLLEETLRAAQAQLQEDLKTLEARRDEMEVRLRAMGREIGRLAARAGADSAAGEQLVRLQESLLAQQQEAGNADERIDALRGRMLEPDELTGAVEAFDPLWESLAPAEKVKLVHLLVQRVEYDGAEQAIAVTFHPTGIQSLVEQHEENAACQTA
jgi:site-specific DNA recombinase